MYYIYLLDLESGDWGLGIGDWAQSPIPNPHPQFIKYFLERNHVNNKVYYM